MRFSPLLPQTSQTSPSGVHPAVSPMDRAASLAEKVEFFTCTYSPADKVSEGGGLADEGEDIEVIETTLEQARAMVASGEIIDAKTVILIQHLTARFG